MKPKISLFTATLFLFACERPPEANNNDASSADTFTLPDVQHQHPTPDVTVSLDATNDAITTDTTPEVLTDSPPDRAIVDAASVDPHQLEVRLMGFNDALNSRFEFRLHNAEAALQAIAILDGITTPNERFRLPGAAQSPGSSLSWYLDADRDGVWQQTSEPAHQATLGVVGPYSMTVTPSSTAGVMAPTLANSVPIIGEFSGFEPHIGVRFELRVYPEGSTRMIGMYRIAALRTPTLSLRFTGLLQPHQRYRIFWFIDLSDNYEFDVRGDHSSEITGEALETGFAFRHDHHTNSTVRE